MDSAEKVPRGQRERAQSSERERVPSQRHERVLSGERERVQLDQQERAPRAQRERVPNEQRQRVQSDQRERVPSEQRQRVQSDQRERVPNEQRQRVPLEQRQRVQANEQDRASGAQRQRVESNQRRRGLQDNRDNTALNMHQRTTHDKWQKSSQKSQSRRRTDPHKGRPGAGSGAGQGTGQDSKPGTRPGAGPGTYSGTKTGTRPGSNPGTRPGSNQGTRPGSLPSRLLASFLGIFSNRKVIVAGAVALTLLVGVPAVDHLVNMGRIHTGVSVGGVDVGGLTKEEAAKQLAQQLSHRAELAPVELYADERFASQGMDEGALALDLSTSPLEAQTLFAGGQRFWLISVDTLGVSVDGEALAAEAYQVGRGTNYLPGRLISTLFGVALPAEYTFEEGRLAMLQDGINTALGTPMRSADIAYTDGSFKLVPCITGYTVDQDILLEDLNAAFLSATDSDRQIIAPMFEELPLIYDEEALALLGTARTAASQPVLITYRDEAEHHWELSSETLAACIGTQIEEQPGGTHALTVQFDGEKLKHTLRPVIGDLNLGDPPQDPRFLITGDVITILEGVNGTGVDYNALADELSAALFGEAPGSLTFELPIGQVPSDLTVADLEALNITEKIVSYTTEYPADQTNRVNNIHTVSDILNNSLIAPGAEWSYMATVGACTPERGFLPANAIDGTEYIEQVGGGICQVASTVFNVILESGFPITERVAHSRYSTMYPHGRDATVSNPSPDLKFVNESGNWLLLTFSYTANTVTATMWGVPPGYTVEIVDGAIIPGEAYTAREVENPELPAGERVIVQEGMDGFSTTITRYVYDLAGNLVRETTFPSTYFAAVEITEVGTKPR